MEKLLKIFFVGRMYTITNFQVKEYTELDKWKCVTTDKQLMFTNQTSAKEIDEREYLIPHNCFDFCDLGDVKNFVKQSTYLAGMWTYHKQPPLFITYNIKQWLFSKMQMWSELSQEQMTWR